MEADAVQGGVGSESERIKRVIVTECNALLNLLDADSADTGNRPGKVMVNDLL